MTISAKKDRATGGWADEEVDYLKKNYKAMAYSDIGRHLGRPRAAVCAKAGRLGLVKGERTPNRFRNNTSTYIPGNPMGVPNKPKSRAGRPPKAPGATEAKGWRFNPANDLRVADVSAGPKPEPDANSLAVAAMISGAIDPRDRDIKRVPLTKLDPETPSGKITKTCRWPIGDPAKDDFGFCSHEALPGLPYCRGHCNRAFLPPQPRKAKSKPRENVHEPSQDGALATGADVETIT